jgi:hypothetical protein
VQYVQESITGDARNAALVMLRQDTMDLKKRQEVLERTPTVQTGSGPPTQPARDGTLYIDITGSKIYARAAGTWKSVAIA